MRVIFNVKSTYEENMVNRWINLQILVSLLISWRQGLVGLAYQAYSLLTLNSLETKLLEFGLLEESLASFLNFIPGKHVQWTKFLIQGIFGINFELLWVPSSTSCKINCFSEEGGALCWSKVVNAK